MQLNHPTEVARFEAGWNSLSQEAQNEWLKPMYTEPFSIVKKARVKRQEVPWISAFHTQQVIRRDASSRISGDEYSEFREYESDHGTWFESDISDVDSESDDDFGVANGHILFNRLWSDDDAGTNQGGNEDEEDEEESDSDDGLEPDTDSEEDSEIEAEGSCYDGCSCHNDNNDEEDGDDSRDTVSDCFIEFDDDFSDGFDYYGYADSEYEGRDEDECEEFSE